MKLLKIDKEGWEKGLDKLQVDYQLYGPGQNGEVREIALLQKGERPDLDQLNTRLSPKSVVYPQSQTMLEYSLDETDDDVNIMREVSPDDAQKAVLGIRPCDAASFQLVKKNFDNPEYPDPYWIQPYEATTFVGLACDEPGNECFCTSVGGSPYGESGLDVLLVEQGNDYLAKVMTEKGENLVKTAGWSEYVDNAADLDSQRKAAESKMSSTIDFDQIQKNNATDLFDAPIWEDIAFACLNCGTCTFSCPTCWCFDIQDENQGKNGKRMRNWDSCMYPLFTLEGSGHNPRPKKEQRVRQRFMHKLKYYMDKYEAGLQCVGCGRCIKLCPVNIDIRTVCEKMNNYQPA